jgi:hypothetical protein
MISSRQHFERHLPFFGRCDRFVIQDRPGADFGPGHYAPVWEQAPHDPSIINFDLLVRLQPRLSRNVETRPVMSEVTDLDFFYGGAIRDEVDHPHSFRCIPSTLPSVRLCDCHGRPCWVPCRGVVG